MICLGVNSGDDRQARPWIKTPNSGVLRRKAKFQTAVRLSASSFDRDAFRGVAAVCFDLEVGQRPVKLVEIFADDKPMRDSTPQLSRIGIGGRHALGAGLISLRHSTKRLVHTDRPMARGLIYLAIATSAIAQPIPVTTPVEESTNRYYLNTAWDNVANAQQYAVGTFSNSFLVQMTYSFTNWASVSNLPLALDAFELRAYSIGVAGQSDYSDKAQLWWSTLWLSNDLTNWVKAPAVEFDPRTNACGFLRLSNWNYRPYMHRQ